MKKNTEKERGEACIWIYNQMKMAEIRKVGADRDCWRERVRVV